MNKLPKFDNYQEEGPTDNGYESLQDFFLSWTIRCSANEYREVNKKLQEYARRIVFIMIFGNNNSDSYKIENEIPDEFKVLEVKTKRQLGEIDLLAEIQVIYKSENKKYLLNIENKWYSGLRAGQLKKYRNYTLKHFPEYEIVNLLITCDECRKNYEIEKTECRKNNYKYLTLEHLSILSNMEKIGQTNNDLFDEYWFE